MYDKFQDYTWVYIMFTNLSLSFFRNSFSGSIANGIIYPPEKKASLLLEGGNQEFYILKSLIKKHVTLAGGATHFEALQVITNTCVKLIEVIENDPVSLQLYLFVYTV